MTDYRRYLDPFLEEGLSPKKAKSALRKEVRRLFRGDSTLFDKYEVQDEREAMRKADKILAWLSGDALTLAETDYTDVSLDSLSDTHEDGFEYTAQEKKESLDKIFREKRKKRKIRILTDGIKNFLTYFFSLISVVVLVGIVYYCVSTGGSTFSLDFIAGDDVPTQVSAKMDNKDAIPIDLSFDAPSDMNENCAFSKRWGIVFEDTTATDGSHSLTITYVDPQSPFHKMRDGEGNPLDFTSNFNVTYLSAYTDFDEELGGIQIAAINPKIDHAEQAAEKLNGFQLIFDAGFELGGGGIKGPLIATLWLILFSLLFSLPLGIGAAIYLSVYAKKNRVTEVIRTLIDMISGIPSIIFGLAGAIIFIPIFSGGSGIGNILSGAATLACMVLPTIIKNTEEAIRVIPPSLKNASLALGASQTQTVFKVILPNSIPGILTGGLLAIGRIIGESAALIFAMGTGIKDVVTPTTGNVSSLAVYIWKVVSGAENPNYKAASATAILILIVVLILNITVKLIASKLDKFTPKPPKSWPRRVYEKFVKNHKLRKEIVSEKKALPQGGTAND